MPIKNKEFDNTFLKTPQSRSIKFFSSKNSGFTLIELLVVISIIALLSTIVFGAIQDSRIKARNTAKNNLVLEYIKALEMYRDDNNGFYPSHTENPLLPKCVGYTITESCYANAYTGSDSINSAFSKYITGDFSHKLPVMNGSTDLRGIQYVCSDDDCNSYKLIWILEKQVSNCILNSTQSSPFFNNTKCAYPQL